MANVQEFNKEEVIQILKDNIYNILKNEESEQSKLLKKEFNELKIIYEKYSKEEESELYSDIKFHNTTVFNKNNFDPSLFKKYRVLFETRKNKIDKPKIIDDMYKKIINITNILSGRTDLHYAIYFREGEKIYRSYLEGDIDVKNLTLTGQNEISAKHRLSINNTKFKKWAMAKSQNRALDVTEHYNEFLSYLQKTYKGKIKIPSNQGINEGHIIEAFERHLYNEHNSLVKQNKGEMKSLGKYDWDEDEPWRLLRISMGNDPWYTGGDVENIQVKFLNKGQSERQVTTFNSIEDMYNFLNYLINDNEGLKDEDFKRRAEQTAKLLYNKVDEEINNYANKTAEEIIKNINESFKKGVKLDK